MAKHVLRHFSFDKVVGVVVVVGCVGLLVEADAAGRAPLANETRALDCPPLATTRRRRSRCATRCSSSSIKGGGGGLPQVYTPHINWRKLEQDGFLVLDNFLTTHQVREACQSIRDLDAKGKFQSNPNSLAQERDDDGILVRTDRIYMFRGAGECGLRNIRNELASFARTVADSDFGEHDDTYDAASLQVPQQMQVSIYGSSSSSMIDDDDDDDDENNAKHHDYYTSHLDSSGNDSIFKTGLLGWLRSRYLRKRYLTCICYLNENWKEGDGGCLRLHKRGATPGTFDSHDYIDVPPVAGRLVVFYSLHQWHAVLPTHATRYACSLWLTLN